MKNTDKPKRGRPVSPRPKTGQVRMRVDLAEKGRWVQAARRDGATLSQWLRRLANDHS
jgi:hypothetical protein